MKNVICISIIAGLTFATQDLQAYTGQLKCSNLQDELTKFSALDVKSYCKEAIQACRIRQMLDRLDPAHPLHKVLDGRIQERNSLALEICELAFLDHDPEHYEKNLKRSDN